MEGAANITIEEAYLLFEVVGSEIELMHMKDNEINPVSIVNELKEFIISVKRELYPPDSLRQTTVVALAKVLAMRLGHANRWCLEHFGTITVREPYSKVYQRRKKHGLARNLNEVDTPAHILTPTDCIGSPFHSTHGLREVLEHLVHPSIMKREAMMKLLYKTVTIYEQNDERAETSLLVDELSTSSAEHATALRKYALTNPEHLVPVPLLEERGPGSKHIINSAIKRAILK